MNNSNQQKNEVLQRIDQLCRQRSWSHYALARYSNVPYSSISNMFSRNTYPSLPVLFKLCSGFHIHVSDFFRDPARNDYTLSPREKGMVDSFRSLGFHDQDLVLAYLQGLHKET